MKVCGHVNEIDVQKVLRNMKDVIAVEVIYWRRMKKESPNCSSALGKMTPGSV